MMSSGPSQVAPQTPQVGSHHRRAFGVARPSSMSATRMSAHHVVAAAGPRSLGVNRRAPRAGAARRRAFTRVRATTSAEASSSPAIAPTELEALRGVRVRRATDGEEVDVASIVPTEGRVIVPFLTQFADFDSWELAQKLVRRTRRVPNQHQTIPIREWSSKRCFWRRVDPPRRSTPSFPVSESPCPALVGLVARADIRSIARHVEGCRR